MKILPINVIYILTGHLGLLWEDYQHAVIDEFLCMVVGCALGTDVCHWMFKKVNMAQGQQDGPLCMYRLAINTYIHKNTVLCCA